MLRNKSVFAFCFFFLLLSLFPLSAKAGVPDWLRAAAQQPVKKYADDVNAVMLLDDQETTVRDNGDIVTHQRSVFRILRPEGRAYARLDVPFSSETKINYMKAWSITAKGQEYEAKGKDSFERSLTTYEVFSDDKEKVLLVPGADVGTVIGFEYEQRERPYVFQDGWSFQSEIPVERSRYTLHLPSNWEYRISFVNHPDLKPVEQGSTYVWEVSDVPRIQREYNEPPYAALAGHAIVTFFSQRAHDNTYKSWADLAAWHARLIAGSFTVSPSMQQKVQELAPPSLPLLDRIKALAGFAQRDIRYAAIEVGIGGLRPHSASEVFANRYGDCKDKATLLSTMLAQIGVKSFYMPIYDERGIFTATTPPNLGFDHVILAIQLPEGSFKSPMPALYDDPKLGHLLIFDPTNDLVPFGQIPYYEQDSFALLVTDGGGALIHLPVTPPEMNAIHRTANLTLLPDGTLQGEIQEKRSGYLAMTSRMYLRNESQSDRRKMIEHFLGSNLTNFRVDSFEVQNADDINKDLVLRYKFTADHYAKNAGSLLLVRPRVLGEKVGALDGTKPRLYPYDFEAPTRQTDVFTINLPEGYKVDELPEPTKADFAFGDYKSKIEDSGGTLKYSREYEIKATSIPPGRIGELKTFFHQINADERNMAVLKKVN
ncbi:MAG: DUF3857 domain-containing transglutaminase family protein [Actinomycetota bacterium]